MRNKGNTLRERSPADKDIVDDIVDDIIDEPIYHVPNEQQEQVIDIEHNTAYGHI